MYHCGRFYLVGNAFFFRLANFMYFVLDFEEIINKKMESHDVNDDVDRNGERHSSTLEGRFNKTKAAYEAQNARFNEFSKE